MRARYALLGVLVLVACIAYMAPARLLAIALADQGPTRLTHARASIWKGAAALEHEGQSLGSLSWQFDAGGLAHGEANFDWQLAGTGHTLSGLARFGPVGLHCSATGTVSDATMRRLLAPYWIETTGDVGIERIRADVTYGLHLRAMVGELSWSGGEVRYRLAGEQYRMVLPPLAGMLGTVDAEPTLTVFAQEVDAPLLHVRLGADGWLNIGVTKKLTRMAGFPWPGNEPDHAIVIDVSERLF